MTASPVTIDRDKVWRFPGVGGLPTASPKAPRVVGRGLAGLKNVCKHLAGNDLQSSESKLPWERRMGSGRPFGAASAPKLG